MPDIHLWYGSRQVFGQHGTPQAFVNLVGRVSCPETLISLTATVNATTTLDLAFGPDRRRLDQPGDFNVEIPVSLLHNGANAVVIRAEETSGQVTEAMVHLEYLAGRTWELPYQIKWNEITDLQEAAQVVNGRWAIGPDGLRPVEPGYDRLVAIGDMAWRDYEVIVPITFHGFDPIGRRFPSCGGWAGLVLRWQGHADWSADQPRRGWYPLGAIVHYGWRGKVGRYVLRIFGNAGHAIAEDPDCRELALGQRYWFRARVETASNGPSRYALKVWADSQPEPTAWALQGFGPFSELETGSLLLAAHHADVTFGDVAALPLA